MREPGIPALAAVAAGDGADVVRAAARAFEHDRYLAALLAPASARDDLLALAAFAGELARIPALVSEPTLGAIRLQWWRDAIDAGLGREATPAGHPIADAVGRALRRRAVSATLVHGVIDAQAERLDDRPFADLAALEAHLAAWDGGLFELAWRLLGGTGTAPGLLASAGVAYGLARCLVETPALLAQGRILLPGDSLAAHGLAGAPAASPQAIREPAEPARSDGWHALLAELVVHTEHHIAVIARGYQEADASMRLAALPIALVRPYLRVSQRIDIAVLEAPDIGPLTRVWRLWRTSRTGRV